MVFSSNAFLFLFLPLFLAVYYLTPNRRRLRNYVILGGSYLFYGWWRLDFLLLFAGVTAFNFLIGGRIAHHGARQPIAKRWMQLGVGVNLAALGYFKYANFGVASFNELTTSLGFVPFQLSHVLLPIGISFYTFESISYIVDVYRGDATATRHPVDFATFVSLFPHLIAGPIFRYKDLAGQFEQREHSLDLFGRGAVRFMQGFVKKVIIADTLAPLIDHCFALPNPSTADAWFGALAYTMQIYFDFSGYSDMAIGLGMMLGFHFKENFRFPYISQSNTEYWRRWHLSLSNYLRDYLYISLGGNRGSEFKTYRNVFLTMLLGGIWHGANWTFVLWGAWNGLSVCIERWFGVKGRPTSFKIHFWAITFFLVVLNKVMFRAATVGDAWRMYTAMFRFDAGGLSAAFSGQITQLQLLTLGIAHLAIVNEVLREYKPKGWPVLGAMPKPAWAVTLLVPLFVLAIMKLSAQGYSAFLYFQF